MEKLLETKNNLPVRIADIPVVPYSKFFEVITFLLRSQDYHILSYIAYPTEEGLKFICAIADDPNKSISVISHIIPKGAPLKVYSMMPKYDVFHSFERDIHEKYGVIFEDNHFLKPLRYSHDRVNQNEEITDYPFYKIEGNELHEVGVGPIHAGIIEPGHFRFLCAGERVLHLEIQLGWQHRGIEWLFLQKSKLNQRATLAEQVAGDTAVGHGLAYAQAIESLAGLKIRERLNYERVIALEIERIGMHLFDLSNLCTGAAYQLGNATLGVLRTPTINFFQTWCGNRFAKGLIRPGGSFYPFTPDLKEKMLAYLDNMEERYTAIADKFLNLSGIVLRFQDIGTLTRKQMYMIGAVGVTAKMAGLKRDSRWSHPFAGYHDLHHEPVIFDTGDIYARIQVRHYEILQSIKYLRRIAEIMNYDSPSPQPLTDDNLRLAKNCLTFSITEGWRGEIVHTAITDDEGKICCYKIKDPSMHNWWALALSLRDREISDFPINNKSYDHSYCGHDL
jgi:Ni,Fe-hydrogenase III large subunit